MLIFGFFETNAFFDLQSPTRPITCNMGMKMPGWYDILDIGSIDKGEDEAGLEASKSYRTNSPLFSSHFHFHWDSDTKIGFKNDSHGSCSS